MTTIIVTFLISGLLTSLAFLLILNLASRDKYLQHEINADFGVADPDFERAMGSVLGPGFKEGNKVETLINGCCYFPAMLEDIKAAQKSITFETFIYWSGDIGRQYTDALIERAENGVRVHLLVDWMGSWKMETPLVEAIKASKIHFERYRSPNWHNILNFNNRTHRKLLIIDGRIGYTGGAGIADSWDGDAKDTKHWRDTQFRVQGPVVSQIQAAFMDNWMQTHAEVLLGPTYFPPEERVGDSKAQMFMSGPGEGSESVRLMYLVSISCARKSVRLAQSYFVPDSLSIETLTDAARRGVQVEIILQGPTDAPFTLRASRSRWKPLLEAGIKMYQFQPAMFHCKTMIIDDLWVSVGSSNFDARSFRLNDEANLNVWDADFAREQLEIFENDKGQARLITLQEHNARSRYDKAMDWFAGLFRAQM